jgi:hypothetical protein
MLEPEIGALAIRWVADRGRELCELDLLIAELHRQHIHWPGRQAEVPSRNGAQVECVAIEALRAVEIEHS